MTTTTRGRKSAASLQSVALMPLRRPPAAPANLCESAVTLWDGIALSLPYDFFRPADIPLLAAYCTAASRKDWLDKQIEHDGIIIQGAPHPGLRMSRDEANLMATLAVKLRLCPSSRTRPESASLKTAHSGTRPWDDRIPASEFFDD